MASSGGVDSAIAEFRLVGPDTPEAEALVAIIRRLSVARSLPELMEVVTQAARGLLQADGITFVLRDGALCHYAEEDAIAPLWRGRRFPASACISGWCMETGQAVAIPDIYADPRIPHEAYRPTFVRSLAMAPVRQEEPIAALGAYWAREREVAPRELELLQTIANAAALALALVELREEREARRSAVGSRASAAVRDWRAGLGLGSVSSAGGAALLRPAAIGVGLALAAWAVRLALGPLVGAEIPYLAFFGAVLLAVAAAGQVGGIAAATAGGLFAYASFARAPGEIVPRDSDLWALLAFWTLSALLIAAAAAMRRAMRREEARSRRLALVGGELQHRMKNYVTIVQSLALQTARSSGDTVEFERKLGERLQALATAQTLLASDRSGAAGLSRLVAQTLAPFGADERIEVAGAGDAELDEPLALALALILNELATNALKHGALSTEAGRVELSWSRRRRGRIQLEWCERDGPPVAAPAKPGFGSRLIEAALPRSRGEVRIEFAADGLRCRVDFDPSSA